MRVRVHRVVDGDTVFVARVGGFLSFLRSGKPISGASLWN